MIVGIYIFQGAIYNFFVEQLLSQMLETTKPRIIFT